MSAEGRLLEEYGDWRGGAADIDGYGWRTLSEEKNLNCGTGSQKFLEDAGEMFMETFAGEKPGRRETISSLFFWTICAAVSTVHVIMDHKHPEVIKILQFN